MDGKQLLRIGEVAALLDVSTRTVRNMVRRGELAPAVKVGEAARWDRREIEEFLIYLKICRRVECCQAQSDGPGAAPKGRQ